MFCYAVTLVAPSGFTVSPTSITPSSGSISAQTITVTPITSAVGTFDGNLTISSVRVVDDQIGTPTYTLDLARLLVDMIETEKYGYYHATNEGGYISWYDFCVEFYRQYGLKTKVIPVRTVEYGLSKASRPYNSRLNKGKLIEAGFMPLPKWQDAVCRYLKEAEL